MIPESGPLILSAMLHPKLPYINGQANMLAIPRRPTVILEIQMDRDLFEIKLKRCTDPRDPKRCQAVDRQVGQCMFVAEAPSKYCLKHGANRAVASAKKSALRNYMLSQHFARAAEQGGSSEIKSLRDEIGLTRMFIEKHLNLNVKEECDILLQSGPVLKMILVLKDLVVSCHKLEKDMGMLLDRPQIMQFADEIIQVIREHIDDSDLMMAIAEDIVSIIERFGEEDEQD
jgi:hypothetical protein